ncbi:MAG TPA: 50S ribosomal protein L6 [Candidatus Krumholzibacteria bacterium]|nr:50S ribosomal protein L6 [Candidatus Krumholzibacteria bacterium]HPD72068.1 50S ribosomal protein L6 [Candidatus Krumholzibacteria bacterium]HRY40999.1 50S ribosomal protein L6 [Candidatus Krumholzibacteria bacterium]
MSRIGNKPIVIPAGVTVTFAENMAVVKGPKGELSQHVPPGLQYDLADGRLTIKRPDESKPMKARHGLVRALIANQIVGVTTGWQKVLLIEGVGYRAAVKGAVLDLQLQFSHPAEYRIPAGVTIECPEPTKIVVKGLDKQQVGQVAAEIRAYRKPEPYKGKGIRYEGETIIRKAGKAAGK